MSAKAEFFEAQNYALIGGGQGRSFPKMTKKYLESSGKRVHAIDLSDKTADTELEPLLDGIPKDTEAVIMEVPKDRTASVVEAVLERGFDNLWLHQMTDTEDAVALCEAKGASVQTGSCAVMYLAPTASPHALHRGIWKLIGRY